ncbi:MAG TPA: guanylate kinase [Rhizomicrobium sp.]|jgi:guanylate kinase
MSGVARRGLMLVLSSPSGAGKTTLSRRLLEHDPNLRLSISMTTRKRRGDEREGIDYQFVTREAFEAAVARDAFLEHAVVFDNLYGTPRAAALAALAEGRDVLFDIDWQGTQQVRERAGDDLVSIFVLPPSQAELERRLRSRAQDPDDVVAARMAKAAGEISHWAEYDYVIINDDVDRALNEIVLILAAERLKRTRQTGLSDFVRNLLREQ